MEKTIIDYLNKQHARLTLASIHNCLTALSGLCAANNTTPHVSNARKELVRALDVEAITDTIIQKHYKKVKPISYKEYRNADTVSKTVVVLECLEIMGNVRSTLPTLDVATDKHTRGCLDGAYVPSSATNKKAFQSAHSTTAYASQLLACCAHVEGDRVGASGHFAPGQKDSIAVLSKEIVRIANQIATGGLPAQSAQLNPLGTICVIHNELRRFRERNPQEGWLSLAREELLSKINAPETILTAVRKQPEKLINILRALNASSRIQSLKARKATTTQNLVDETTE